MDTTITARPAVTGVLEWLRQRAALLERLAADFAKVSPETATKFRTASTALREAADHLAAGRRPEELAS